MKITPSGHSEIQPMSDQDMTELQEAIDRIVEKAQDFGLDFYEMRYEVCPADIIYTFGAYAMPTRFSHWSFGKSFHQMKTQYDYGMSKIYELVINSDPCYAFLLDSNSLLQNKLIAAHVLAHCDFFKNNYRFRHTNRQMVSAMGTFANRVLEYEHELGRATVERFLDAVLAIHEHVDPYPDSVRTAKNVVDKPETRPETPYDDLWALDSIGKPGAPAKASEQQRPKPAPTRDLLMFLMDRSDSLQDWQRDILSSLRQEMLYFRPQMETKIMNEGWASIWHARIMREMDLTPDESLEFARMHSSVLAPSRFQLNPYHLGFHIFEDIEKRFGREKIFEVREVESDVSFIRNYLTKDLVEKLDLFLFAKQGDEWRITATGWQKVRDGIVRQITNCGFPYIYAEDHDYQRRGELYLRHAYEDVELDTTYVRKTLPHVHHIWQRPVHLETVEDDHQVMYSFNGSDVERRVL
ncbi:MAG TPA: SpoVR family protein [Symbiobacteriaceae bacterium]|nr:SpoVR family protein [Symbiobacteriaceae bacterium]